MSAEFSMDRAAFNAFLDHGFMGDGSGSSLEGALAAFRAYQRDLDRLKGKLRPSIEQADRGESAPLDLEAVLDRVQQRVTERGTR